MTPNGSPPDDSLHKLPARFLEVIIEDIPTETWARIFKSNPTLRTVVLEGFTAPAKKLRRLLQQPHVVARLQRSLSGDEAVLDEILQVWGQEQLTVMAFLEMLDRDFVRDNLQSLKNLLGPERFLAGLKVLGILTDPEYRSLLDEDFWERQLDMQLVSPLVPFWDLWNDLVRQFPQAGGWLRDSGPIREGAPAEDRRETGQPPGKEVRALEERCLKLQKKLNKAEVEKAQLLREVSRYRREQDELRKRLLQREESSGQALREALEGMRLAWFKRYQAADQSVVKEAVDLLDSLLRRTEQAFVHQQRADEEYGRVAAVRQKLLQVELYLKEIERIYAESLVVHSEVARAKAALLQARDKLLKLPGIEKALQPEPLFLTIADLRRQIRFMEEIPENLARITEIRTLIARLADLGLVDDPRTVFDDLEHKRRQIMEQLYAQFQMLQDQLPRGRHFENLEDFVESRQSKNYDFYVDGYNILLQLHGKDRSPSRLPLTSAREQFTSAVAGKSHLFRRVYLVFDGQEETRDRLGNAEIIYTDKKRGQTADTYIIQAIQKRKDRLVLLATGDQEIIRSVENRLYALVDPYHFYLFVYDMRFPDLI